MKFLAGMSQRAKAILAIVLCAVLWSTGGILIKLVNLNPIAIAGSRSFVAAVVLIIITGKPKFSFSKAQLCSALAYTGTVLLYVSSNKYTTSANAILLQYTAPIYAAVFGYLLLKEKVGKVDILTIGVVIAGMALFFMDELAGGNIFGNMLAILSGVCFALQAVFLRMQKDSTPAASLILGNIFTAVIGMPFIFADIPTMTEIRVLIVMGVFQLGLAYTLYSFAIKYLTALEAILIPVLEPILNPVWVVIFAGEYPGKWTVVGGAVVILAVTGRGIYYEIYCKNKALSDEPKRVLDKVNS